MNFKTEISLYTIPYLIVVLHFGHRKVIGQGHDNAVIVFGLNSTVYYPVYVKTTIFEVHGWDACCVVHLILWN